MNFSYPSKKISSTSSLDQHSFDSDKGLKYNVVISKDKKTPHSLMFYAAHTKNKPLGITSQEGASAHKVFSTVNKIALDHLNTYRYNPALTFSADNSEPSRVRLYHLMAKKIDPGYKARDKGDETEFHVRNPNYDPHA